MHSNETKKPGLLPRSYCSLRPPPPAPLSLSLIPPFAFQRLSSTISHPSFSTTPIPSSFPSSFIHRSGFLLFSSSLPVLSHPAFSLPTVIIRLSDPSFIKTPIPRFFPPFIQRSIFVLSSSRHLTSNDYHPDYFILDLSLHHNSDLRFLSSETLASFFLSSIDLSSCSSHPSTPSPPAFCLSTIIIHIISSCTVTFIITPIPISLVQNAGLLRTFFHPSI